MEPVKPPSGPTAPQVAARVTPLGRGWMLVALEAGAALRHPGLGVDLRLSPDEAEALRSGDLRPEAVAERAQPAAAPVGPNASVTVAFSPEAMRLSGRMGAGPRGAAQGKAGGADLPPAQVRARLRALWIGAILLALLVLVLIGTG